MTNNDQQMIEYTDCYVAFLDILGFKNLVKMSEQDPNLLEILTKALNTMAKFPSGTKESRTQDDKGNFVSKKWQIQTRFFSDNVLIFMPIESHGINQMLFMVRYLHDRLVELEILMRGAVTIGNMYWNEKWSNPTNDSLDHKNVLYDRNSNQNLQISLGQGLIEAYELEQNTVCYPRILITEKLYNHIEECEIEGSPLGLSSPPKKKLIEFIKTDFDKIRFLDLLNQSIRRSDTERIIQNLNDDGTYSVVWDRNENTHELIMNKIKIIIEKQFDNSQTTEKIKMKYGWLKSYYESCNSSNP